MAEANQALRAFLSEVDDGTFVESRNLTLTGYLTDEWLPASGPPRVTYETWTNRRMYVTNYIVPRIGEIKGDRSRDAANAPEAADNRK